MKKKRPLTLLEVIISLSLTALLLTVLINSATRLFSTRARIESAKQEVLAKTLIQERLSTLFSELALHKGLPEKEPQGPLESLDGKTLTLFLENQIDPDPSFCGSIKGELFVESEALIFQLAGKNDTVRKEILLEGVKSISFQFFAPFEEPPRLIEAWKDRPGELPAHLILTLTPPLEDKEYQLAFFFPSHDTFVVYHPPIKNSHEVRK